MLRIFDSLKSLISQELVNKASANLAEDPAHVSAAVPTIIASILGAMLQKGDTTQLKSVLDDAGKANILSDIKGIFNGNFSNKQKSTGQDLLNALFGNKTNDFNTAVASASNVTVPSADKLSEMIAPVVAGFLGNKLSTNGYSLSGLLSQLNEEKHSFLSFIPNGVANIFGLSAVSDLGNNVKYTKVDTTTKKVYEEPVTTKKGGGWWKWLLLLLLLLLLFFWWRSCNRTDRVEYADRTVVRTDTVRPVNTPPATDGRTATELTLADGTRINAYRGGIEDQMIKYLQSGDYKNASADDLRNKWFEFDDIRFEFGSATELMGNSKRQVDNIAAILKNYKDAKVLIAGNADNKGSDQANMAISRERAKTIERMLENAGVGAQVVRTEGLGDENAEVPASASDDARSPDRDIALRFVK